VAESENLGSAENLGIMKAAKGPAFAWQKAEIAKWWPMLKAANVRLE